MNLKFSISKTLACVGFICKANENAVDLYRLMKTVYLADRKSLVETFRPITNDLWVNMQYGPLNSTTYDLAKGKALSESDQLEWNKYFVLEDDNIVRMIKAPNLEVLTGLEEEAIKNAIDSLKDCRNFYDIRDKVHALPEYEETKSSSPVSIKEILKSEYKDYSDNDIDEIIQDIQAARG